MRTAAQWVSLAKRRSFKVLAALLTVVGTAVGSAQSCAQNEAQCASGIEDGQGNCVTWSAAD